jgi:hypothetical protein
MARPKRLTFTPSAVDVNSIFEDQTTAGSGAISLDGADVASGEWVSPDGLAHRISLESTGNISAVTFTVAGFQDSQRHIALSEDITGPNNATVESSGYFAIITSITVDGAVGTNTEGGFVDEFISQGVPLNNYGSRMGLNVIVSGTINYSLQQTFDDIQSLTDTINYINHDDSSVVSSTTSQNANYDKPPIATRLVVNSYSSGAAIEFNITQAAH